jgi:hypothetical protein
LTAGADVFVGRHDELALISAAVVDAAAGRPWVVFIEGPAGVETRLLRQARAALGPDVTHRMRSGGPGGSAPPGPTSPGVTAFSVQCCFSVREAPVFAARARRERSSTTPPHHNL